jgi:hypothetical protein
MWNNEIPRFFYVPEGSQLNYDPPDFNIEDQYQKYYFEQMHGRNVENLATMEKNLSMYVDWFAGLAEDFLRYNERNSAVINGQVEFPTQYATEHSGNLKVSYATVIFDPSWQVGTYQWIPIKHNYGDGTRGQRPRGWFLMANSESGVASRWLDQIISSSVTAGYTAAGATATWTNATTLTAAAALNGWVNNFVSVGDEVKWQAPVTYAAGAGPYVDFNTNPNRVSMVGGTFPANLKAGWFFKFNAGADQTERTIIEVLDSTNIIVAPGYLANINFPGPGAPYSHDICYFDTNWRRITSITGGAADVVTVESPGTDCPTGVAGQYVIRRPADETYAYVRYLGPDWTETTFAFY